MDHSDINPINVPNFNLDNHFYILYSLSISSAIIIFILIILKLKKYIFVDSQKIKVGSVNRKTFIDNDIPRDVKMTSKKKRRSLTIPYKLGR